jgi:23S rRNA pseudouridine1911/1915/1917 synthase
MDISLPTSVDQRILFEDNHLIIINKLPSEIVQGDKTGDQPLSETVKSYIKKKHQKPGEVFLGVVHRIDRPVSGAVIFARTSKALTRMNEMVKNHQMTKRYWAIVKNKPPLESDRLEHYLLRNEKQNKSYVRQQEVKDSKQALLNYQWLASSKDYHLIEIELITGRHHQIRAQLAAIGCPIKGDLKYGFPRSNPDASISLHARSVAFTHPVTKQIVCVTAPPPQEVLWDFFVKALA